MHDSNPVSADPENDQTGLAFRRRVIVVVAWVAFTTLSTLVLVDWASGALEDPRIWGRLVGFTILLAIALALRRNRVGLAGAFLVLGILATVSVSAMGGGGLIAPNVVWYALATILAAWLGGPRLAVAAAMLSVLAAGGITLMEATSLLPARIELHPYRLIFNVTLALAAVAAVAILAGRDMARRIAIANASVAQLQLITENAPGMLARWGRDLRCRWTNAQYAAYYGRTVQDLLGRHLSEILSPEAFTDAMPHVERALRGEAASFERVRNDAEGRQRYYEVQVVPEREQDRVVGYLVQVHDITNKRRRQRMLESIVDGTARASGDEFFRELSRHLAMAFGVDRAMIGELTPEGTRLRSLARYESGEFLPEVSYALAGTPCKVAITEGTAAYVRGVAERFPDDLSLKEKRVEGYYGVALRARSGEMLGLINVKHRRPLELTEELRSAMEIFAARAAAELERQRADDELRRSEQRFKGIFHASPIALSFYTEAEGRFIDCNDAYLAMLERTREEVIGSSGLEMGLWNDQADRDRVRELRRARGGVLRGVEISLRAKSGQTREFLAYVEPFCIGETNGVLAQLIDISSRKAAERALEASEARFKDFAGASADWFWETDAAGRFTWMSDAVERVAGIPAAWHYGKTRLELASGGNDLSSPEWQAHLAVLDRHEPFRDFRFVRRTPQGAERWLESSGVPFFDKDGAFLGYRGAASDVTLQVLAERRAAEADERLKSAIEHLDTAFSLWDRDDRLLLVNRKFRDISVAPELLVPGVHVSELLRAAATRDHIPAADGRLEEWLQERLAARAHTGAHEMQRGDRWFMVSNHRLPNGFLVTQRFDITERKQIEEDLRASRHLLELVIDAIPMSIFVKDRNSNYVMANKYAADFFETTKEALAMRPTAELPTGDDTRLRSLETDQWVFRNRATLRQEAWIQRPDGTAVPFHSTKIPLFDDAGGLIGLLGVNRDVTEEKRAREELLAGEQRFAAIFRDAPTPLSLHDAGSGRFADANPAWLELFGYAREQVIGRTSLEFGLYRDPSERDKLYGALSRDGFVDRLLLEFQRADGSLRQCLISGRVVDIGGKQMIVNALDDVTEQQQANRAIRESEERFRQIFDNASEAMWLVAVRPDGRLEYEMINRAHTAITGLRPERTVGKTPHEAHPGRNDDYVEGRWRDCLASGEALHYEEDLVLPSGTRTWLTSLVPVRDTDGTIRRIVGIGHDITERKRAEEAVRASEERFAAMFQDSPAPLAVVSMEDQRFRDVNHAWSELFGYAREAVVGRLAADFTVIRDAEGRKRLYEALLKHGKIDGFEYTAIAAQGEERITLVSGRLVTLGGERSVLWSFIDVTELRRTQRELQESEQRFSSIFHNSLVPQVVNDPETRVNEEANAAFCALTGYSREQIVGAGGRNLGLFWDAIDDAAVAAMSQQGGGGTPIEIHLRRSDGGRRTVIAAAFMIETSGKRRLVWSLVDVTGEREAQRQMQALNASLENKVEERTAELKNTLENLKTSQDALLQVEKLAALGRLVAGVAHELNTPIGNALLTASTVHAHTEEFARHAATGLRRSVLEGYVKDAQQASSILLRNLEKAAELIRSFKQVAADQSSSQRRRFALKEVVDEVLLAHHPIFKRTSVDMRADVPEGIQLDSYPGPLGQVLGNLITNAVLHGFEGRTAGSVQVSARQDGSDAVEIAVRDDGRGISEANLKRIFDPFFTTRMGRGGTGLGLSICHRIVTESLGGGIRVVSRLDEGSTFIVRVPLKAPALSVQEAA